MKGRKHKRKAKLLYKLRQELHNNKELRELGQRIIDNIQEHKSTSIIVRQDRNY